MKFPAFVYQKTANYGRRRGVRDQLVREMNNTPGLSEIDSNDYHGLLAGSNRFQEIADRDFDMLDAFGSVGRAWEKADEEEKDDKEMLLMIDTTT